MTGKLSSIYDFPLYYDILFGWDRDRESAFYDEAFRLYGVPAGARVLEVACGTGQVGIRLAKMGWKVTGLDLSEGMLGFLREAARESGVAVETLRGDMADFRAKEPFSAAFSPLGSIAILQTERQLLSHFNAIADALAPRGIYIVDNGFYARAEEASDPANWTWSMTRGPVTVSSTRERITVRDGEREVLLSWEPELRPYAWDDFAACIGKSGRFSVETWHPDLRRSADELSVFSTGRTPLPGNGVRAMLVLRRL